MYAILFARSSRDRASVLSIGGFSGGGGGIPWGVWFRRIISWSFRANGIIGIIWEFGVARVIDEIFTQLADGGISRQRRDRRS